MPHTCPACQTENRIGARFCKRCGSSLTDASATVIAPAPETPAECPACGHTCAPGARFCSLCGVPLRAAVIPQVAAPAPPPDVAAEPAALASRLGGVALAVSLALLLIAGWFWSTQRGSVAGADGAALPGASVSASASALAPVQSPSPGLSSGSPPIKLEVVAEPTAPSAPPAAPAAPAPGTLLVAPVSPAAAQATVAGPGPMSQPTIAPASTVAPGTAPAPSLESAPSPAPASPPAEAGPAQGAPAPRAPAAVRAAPATRVARAPAGPEQACATSTTFTRPFCMSVQCVTAQHRNHPSCVRLRDQERQRLEIERANGTDG